MLIDGTNVSYRWFEARVRLALRSARGVGRPIEKIAVSQWLFDELKYRYVTLKYRRNMGCGLPRPPRVVRYHRGPRPNVNRPTSPIVIIKGNPMTHKTLRELILTDEAAAMEILRVIARDENVQWYTSDNNSWNVRLNTIVIQLDLGYRLPPQPSTVDWSQVGDEIVAFATDADGRSSGYQVIPKQRSQNWHVDFRRNFSTTLWPSFKPGNMPWKESMIIRPRKGLPS